MAATEVISFRVDAEADAKIKASALAAGVKVGVFIERALLSYMSSETIPRGKEGRIEVSSDEILAAQQALADQVSALQASIDNLVTLHRNQG